VNSPLDVKENDEHSLDCWRCEIKHVMTSWKILS
jgi:hypothetical protein